MPGTHPKKAKTKSYDEDQLQRALEAVRQGKSILGSSKIYRVPFSTLRDKVVGNSTPSISIPGRECVLGKNIENALAEGLFELASIGFGRTIPEVMDLVKSYLDKCGENIPQFRNNKPGLNYS